MAAFRRLGKEMGYASQPLKYATQLTKTILLKFRPRTHYRVQFSRVWKAANTSE